MAEAMYRMLYCLPRPNVTQAPVTVALEFQLLRPPPVAIGVYGNMIKYFMSNANGFLLMCSLDSSPLH